MSRWGTQAPLIMILAALSVMSTGAWHTTASSTVPRVARDDPNIGPNSPFFFTNQHGYPVWTVVNGQPALQLTPVTSGAYGGVAWDALSYTGQTVGASINGTFTRSSAAVADGFTIMLFAQNGTSSLSYVNNSMPGVTPTSTTGLPACGYPTITSSTGTQGTIAFPLSTTPYLALQWDPFYGGPFPTPKPAEFNLWVINPSTPTTPCSATAFPGPVGCTIGVPTAMDNIRFDVNYTSATNALGAEIVDISSAKNCSFSMGLSPTFTPPSFGKYWVFVEGNNGAAGADWTLFQSRLTGVVIPPIVCITPSAKATSCPTAPINIGPVKLGSSFTVGVFVQNSAPMGGFMIYVKSDPTYVYPVSATSGALVASPFLTTVCVNGYFPSNSALNDVSCAPADPGGIGPGYDNGPGVVMAETIGGSGLNDCVGSPPCSGMAFNITYTVVGSFDSTNLFFPISPHGVPSGASACMVSSVSSPADVCVLVADAGGGTLPENIQGATVCERCQTLTASGVDDASTKVTWSNAEIIGSSTYDTASVMGVTGFTPTGNVVYTLYTTVDCSGVGVQESPPGGSLLSGGLVPNSTTVGPLAAGSYSFKAVYSGDSEYLSSTSVCEPFTVNKASTTTSGVILSETAGPLPTDTWTVPPGGGFTLGSILRVSAATIGTQVDGFSISGSVTYTLYAGGCTGTIFQTSGPLPIGTKPSDFGGTSLNAGQYCFAGTYSGDPNYNGSSIIIGFNVASGGLGGGRPPFRD